MFPNPWHSESIDKPDSTIALYELICIGIRSWRSHVEVVGRHLQFCQQSWMNTTDIFLKNPKGGIWLRPVINFNTSFTKKSHSGIPKNRIKLPYKIIQFTSVSQVLYSTILHLHAAMTGWNHKRPWRNVVRHLSSTEWCGYTCKYRNIHANIERF